MGRKHGNCHKKPIRKEILEELVLDKIIAELSRPQIMDSIVQELMRRQEQQAREASALHMILKEKKQVDTALNNLVAAIERGIISNTTNKRLHELETRQAELERQALIEKSKLAVQLPEAVIRKFYTKALELEPRLLIDCLVKEILLYDDKIEIYFNSPIKPSPAEGGPDESRGFLFYTEDIRIAFKDPHRSELTRIAVQFEMKL